MAVPTTVIVGVVIVMILCPLLLHLSIKKQKKQKLLIQQKRETKYSEASNTDHQTCMKKRSEVTLRSEVMPRSLASPGHREDDKELLVMDTTQVQSKTHDSPPPSYDSHMITPVQLHQHASVSHGSSTSHYNTLRPLTSDNCYRSRAAVRAQQQRKSPLSTATPSPPLLAHIANTNMNNVIAMRDDVREEDNPSSFIHTPNRSPSFTHAPKQLLRISPGLQRPMTMGGVYSTGRHHLRSHRGSLASSHGTTGTSTARTSARTSCSTSLSLVPTQSSI